MRNKLLKMAAVLLRQAADEFSNHGCNDIDMSCFDGIGFTSAELQQIANDYSKWNGDPENERKFEHIGDDGLMHLLSHFLLQEAKRG